MYEAANLLRVESIINHDATEKVVQRCFDALIRMPTLRTPQANGVLGVVGLAPRAPQAKLRDIADRLGFLCMPFSYFNPEAMPGRSMEQQGLRQSHVWGPNSLHEEIRQWMELEKHGYRLMVLTPPDFYAIERHVMHAEDNAVYAGKPIQSSFNAINMVVP